MNRWAKVEAFLDKEVQRETKRIIAKAKAAMGLGNGGNGHTKPITTKKRVSKGVKDARVLHGRYLGLTRGLTHANKAAAKQIRKEKGVLAAISFAKKVGKAQAGASA